MRPLGIEEARTRSMYVATVLDQLVGAEGFDYHADLAVFRDATEVVHTRD